MRHTHLNPRSILLALSLAAVAAGQIIPIGPPTTYPLQSTAAVPLPQAATAPSAALASKGSYPRDMKLLVVAVDGTEPSYAAVKSVIETLGIPYQVVFTVKPATTGTSYTLTPLPALTNTAGTKGLFQGIVLTSGNLAYCAVSPCVSGLSTTDWTKLETYARDFGVRVATMYAWPEPRWGLAFSQGLSIGTTPVNGTLTGDAPSVFSYLNTATPVPIANTYVYLSTAAPAAGDSTTPFLTVNGLIAGAINRKADGREYLALTVDNNPYLQHSLELGYGILNWVTKGVFIGGRKVYLAPQVDDLFLNNDLFLSTNSACVPVGFVNDPTYDPADKCPTVRMTGADLTTLSSWQAAKNANPQFAKFKVAHAFNGFGAVDETTGALLANDSLVNAVKTLKSKFNWITHTWDHENLDCYNPVPNSGASTCVPATYSQSLTELTKNSTLATTLALPVDKTSIVTPNISGLNNPDFMRAVVNQGIKYLVSDASKPEYLPAVPNTGIPNPSQPSVLMIPRRPTNLFYNTYTSATNVGGSLPDEYNYFFGPNGIFRIGGTTGGAPFFSTVQSYNDIIQTESNNLLAYMLRYEIYPQMYHQSNLVAYNGKQSMLADVHDALFQKFSSISNLPVVTLQETEIGQEIQRRMTAMSAGVSGVLTPGVGVTLTAAKGSAVPLVTGICGGACEAYGGQCLSQISVKSGTNTTLSFSSATCSAPATTTTAPATTTTGTTTTTTTTAAPSVQTLAVKTSLTTLAPMITVAAANKSVTDAITALDNALDPTMWTNGMPNDPAVFDQEKAAAQKLTDAINKNTLPATTVLAIQGALQTLYNADVAIVTQLITLVTPLDAKAATTMKNELNKAADSMAQGKIADAIDHLKKAWNPSQNVL